MSADHLCGVVGAWAVAQVALGGFFVLAYVLRRRELEYLLFGLVCFSLALATAGISVLYTIPEGQVESYFHVVNAAHVGANGAVALNLHFAMHYAGVRHTRRFALGAYVVAIGYCIALLSGAWWADDRVQIVRSSLIGPPIDHLTAEPTVLASSFYVAAAAGVATGTALLVRAYRHGRREALASIVGATLTLIASVNDMLLVTGQLTTEYFLPHAFMVYALAMGSTLVYRYGATAGRLDATVRDLEERTRELRRSYAELEEVQAELVKKEQLAAVGELAAVIAHEVRNPLAVISNAVSTLRRNELREQDRTMLLGIVDEEIARLNRLVTDLLRFARPIEINASSTSVPELVDRAAMAIPTGYSIRVEVEGDAHEVSADAGLLRLVLDNLIANAVQAMRGGGEVRVRVSAVADEGSEPFVRVDVTDDGAGMEADVLGRAVDPFFTTRPSGTGLGLPIVERIMEAHGGRMSIDSAAGRGTTVSLFLPAAKTTEPTPRATLDTGEPSAERLA